MSSALALSRAVLALSALVCALASAWLAWAAASWAACNLLLAVFKAAWALVKFSRTASWLDLATWRASLAALSLSWAAATALSAPVNSSTRAWADLALAWALVRAAWAFWLFALALARALSAWLCIAWAFWAAVLASAKLACFWVSVLWAFWSSAWACSSDMLDDWSWANLSWAAFSSSAAFWASAWTLAKAASAWLASVVAVASLAWAVCKACLALASCDAWSSVELVSTGISVEVSLIKLDSTLKWTWPNLSVWIAAKPLPVLSAGIWSPNRFSAWPGVFPYSKRPPTAFSNMAWCSSSRLVAHVVVL